MKSAKSPAGSVGLREAASVVFALATLLPLLLVVLVLHRSGALWSFEAQISVLLAVTLAVLGFVVFRLMVGRVAQLAGALVGPGASARTSDGAVVPGLGRVTEIGQIGDAFARMLDDLRGSTERLEDLVFKLGALNEIVELAARVPNMPQLLALVLERTMRTVRAATGSIMLLDRHRGVLRVVAARGGSDDAPVGAELPLGEGVAGKVAQVGEATLVDDGAVIWLPIRVEDRIIGVVNLGKGAASPIDPRAFSPMDLQFLSTLMAHVAYALENARLLEDARLNTERLQTVVEDLRTAQTRLVEGETVRALGQMASGMAHHLNNLLAVVSGRLQLLLLRAHDPALRKPLETAERAVGDAAEVVRRVLGFSAAQPVPETIRVDLNEIAADVIELTRPRWQDTAQLRRAMVDIRFEPGDDVVVVGEPAPLREVLMNLVLNALDAMPDGGCLAIRTWTEEGWVYCSVGDSGLGMSADTRQRALEPFFTTKGPKGVGLGLSVTLGVVRRHHGDAAHPASRRDAAARHGAAHAVAGGPAQDPRGGRRAHRPGGARRHPHRGRPHRAARRQRARRARAARRWRARRRRHHRPRDARHDGLGAGARAAHPLAGLAGGADQRLDELGRLQRRGGEPRRVRGGEALHARRAANGAGPAQTSALSVTSGRL